MWLILCRGLVPPLLCMVLYSQPFIYSLALSNLFNHLLLLLFQNIIVALQDVKRPIPQLKRSGRPRKLKSRKTWIILFFLLEILLLKQIYLLLFLLSGLWVKCTVRETCILGRMRLGGGRKICFQVQKSRWKQFVFLSKSVLCVRR